METLDTTAPAADAAGRNGGRRRVRVLGASFTVLSLMLTLLSPTPATASNDWVSAEQRFVNHLNRERAAIGLGTVQVNLQMVRIARDWSGRMAASGTMSHRPDIPAYVHGPWERLGENVGWITYRDGDSLAAAVDRLHQAFMDSPGHKANVLGDYNQVGVGVLVVESGKLWVTFNFLNGPTGAFPLFADIETNTHRKTIEQAWMGDLASGCRFDHYCASGQVTRAQMATFISRALGLAPVVSNHFRDVDPGSLHAGAINALVAAGIAQGCAPERYCPDDAVNRGQMATFMARALQLAPRSSAEFVDVLPTSPHFGAINAVAEEAITAGCDGTGIRYCPGAAVRRDQMASFLARAFPAPVSFWQGDSDPEDLPEGGATSAHELGDPVTYEREPAS